MLLALVGVFAFYPYVQGDVLNNFPSDSVPISVARVLLAVTMVLTYPVRHPTLFSSFFYSVCTYYIHTHASFVLEVPSVCMCWCVDKEVRVYLHDVYVVDGAVRVQALSAFDLPPMEEWTW